MLFIALAAVSWSFRSLIGEDLTRVAPVARESTFFGDGADSPLSRAILTFDQRWVAWAVARNARTLVTEPTQIWAAEQCHPVENALAYGEPVLTLGLLATPAWLLRADPVFAYNAVVMLLPIVSMVAMFVLVRSWTGSTAAALAAGMLFAFHRMKLTDVVHPYYADSCWTAFAFYFFGQWLQHGRWRDVLALAAACALQFGSGVYPLIGATVVAPPFAIWALVRHGVARPPVRQWIVLTLLLGAAAAFVFSPFLGASANLLERPQQLHLPWRTIAFGQSGSPGLLLVGLALSSFLPLREARGSARPSGLRWALLAGVVLGFLLATGGNAGDRLVAELRGEPVPLALPNPYAALSSVLPVLGNVRAPLWTFSAAHVALCALAGLGLARLLERVPDRQRTPAAIAVVAVVAVGTLLPGLPGRLELDVGRLRPAEELLAFHDALSARGNTGPIVELPMDGRDGNRQSRALLLTAYHRRPIAYCWNSSLPAEHVRVQALARRIPEPAAVDALRADGFTTLIVNRRGSRSAELAEQIRRIDALAPDGRWLSEIHSDRTRSAYAIRGGPGGAGPTGDEAASRPPNIVLFISDDHGWDHYGFQGHPFARTPNVDRLADEGVLFTNGYSQAPVCVPALRTLLSGLPPALWRRAREDLVAAHGEIPFRRESRHMPILLPRMLRRAGYTSFAGGKMWEGTFEDAGFDAGTMKVPAFAAVDGAMEFGRESMAPLFEWIDRQSGPWFAWVAPMLPHIPHDPPPELVDLYRDVEISDEARRYYANVTRLDARVGELVTHLRSIGALDDTVLIYLADNGWEQRLQGTTPLGNRLGGDRGKGSMFDRAMHTPIIVRDGRRLTAGSRSGERDVRETIVDFEDVYATILDYAGVEPHACAEGNSFRPNGAEPRDAEPTGVFFARTSQLRAPSAESIDRPPRPSHEPGRFLRSGPWAYTQHAARDEEYVYDPSDGPEARIDGSARPPELTARLRRLADAEEERLAGRHCPLAVVESGASEVASE